MSFSALALTLHDYLKNRKPPILIAQIPPNNSPLGKEHFFFFCVLFAGHFLDVKKEREDCSNKRQEGESINSSLASTGANLTVHKCHAVMRVKAAMNSLSPRKPQYNGHQAIAFICPFPS